MQAEEHRLSLYSQPMPFVKYYLTTVANLQHARGRMSCFLAIPAFFRTSFLILAAIHRPISTKWQV